MTNPAATRAYTRNLIAAAVLTLVSCAETIPPYRYGIDQVDFHGVEQMDYASLASCLASRARPRFGLDIGREAEPPCGEPPFDGSRFGIHLWTWPWTDWVLYDRAVFQRDLQRIERWYRARGFYDARVVSSSVSDPAAQESDRFTDQQHPCDDAEDGDEGCELDVSFTVHEGDYVRVRALDISGDEELSAKLREQIRDTIKFHIGSRFDEADYDASKAAILRLLREATYAKAEVHGDVTVDPVRKRAAVSFRITPGPSCVFGHIEVTGQDGLWTRAILGAPYIEPGDPFSESAVEDTQRAVYGLGVFSSVEVEPRIPLQGNVVDVLIRVVPGRLSKYGVGAGVQSGLSRQGFFGSSRTESVREWDVHAVAFWEYNNFLGGLRHFRIEDRPRLVFPGPFPTTAFTDKTTNNYVGPSLGNVVSIELRQPAIPELHSSLVASAAHDYGPDAQGRDYRRHDIDWLLGPERSFFRDKLFVGAYLHGLWEIVDQDLFSTTEARPETAPPNTHATFLEETIRLDLRNNPYRPTRGIYLELGMQQAGLFLPSSWDYFRFTPEARGYLRLPWGLVLAGRVALGVMEIIGSDIKLSADSRRGDSAQLARDLGPERYRLRGGGSNSNRGFVAGELGDGLDGGIRRWEASLELRIPISEDFNVALFSDAGDVTQQHKFRFDYPQLSLGFGVRYYTIVGPIRLDFGFRVAGMQYFDTVDERPSKPSNARLFGTWPGAFHITIGEPF